MEKRQNVNIYGGGVLMDSILAFLEAVCALIMAILELCAGLLALAAIGCFWYIFF